MVLRHDSKTMPTDEFSFPAVADDYPNFASSPPLWRVPSEASLDSCQGEDGGEEVGECDEVKKMWYSSLVLKRTTEDEEKMDKLWENFNEELSRISSFGRRSVKAVGKSCRHQGYDSDDRGGGLAEFCCVQALKMPRASPAMISARRTPSLLLFLKVFKKLFLLQSSHCPHKKSKSA